jgi:hypothetical protein
MTYNLLHEIVDRHCHPGVMTELKSIKCRLFRVYTAAQQIDVADLLRCSSGVQEQYARIMNVWRKVHVILDGVTSASSQSDQEAALEADFRSFGVLTRLAKQMS